MMSSVTKQFIAFVGLAIIFGSISVTGSHFRGGIFMVRPRPGGAASEMEVFFHISWRRGTAPCSSSTIQNGDLIGSGSLTCQSGCSGTVGSLTFQCTDFSATEDWSYGQNTIYYTFPSSGTVTVSFASCCWISPFSSSWSLTTTFSMTPRSDTNVINSTPRASTSPVVRLQAGCTHEIVIPVSDPDNDVVKCRFATGSDCYDICGGIPGATIDSSSCTITYTANQGTGYKAIALSIEDFAPSDLSTPLSKVNLQFLVFVFSSNELCSASPYFESPPTLKQGICVAVDAGDTFSTQITANSNSSSATISEISTITPSGTNKGSLTQIGNTNSYYVDITWTPTNAQQGQTHVLCYTAVSSTGSTSQQTCIQIDAGILPPQPDLSSLSPPNNDLVNPSSTMWSIQFTSNVQLPTISSFIKFHDANNDQVVHSIDASTSAEISLVSSNTLLITPIYTFPEDRIFYITFEGGVVTSLLGCKPGSEVITDKTFWTFQIKGSSKPATIDAIKVPTESDLYFGFQVSAVCFATGLPLPTVIWYRDGTVLPVGNEISIHQSNETTNITSVLTISSLLVSHEGKYTCKGTNTLSNGTVIVVSSLFYVVISGIIVVNFTGIALSPTALYLSWDVPTVPTIVIQYFVVECDELDTHREWSFLAVETHANVISLHPYYSYSCRVQVVGNDTYSFNTPIIVNTYQAAPSAPPQSPSSLFYANSSSTLNLTWFPPPVDKQNGIILYYRIIMTEVETNINFEFNSNFTYLYLSDLHPYYSYTFTIAAVTISEGPFSSDFTVLMPEDAPTAAPINILKTVLSSQSVQLAWSPPPYEHRNGIIRMYEVLLIDEDGIKHVETTQHTSITVTYLHPNYKYNVTVAAITILKGVDSEVKYFTTLEDAPSQAPGMFNATATSPYSATLTWEPLPHDEQNGVIIEYVIRVSILETNETIYLYSSNTYLVVNTLRPYRTYVCVIAARTAIGIGPYGNQFILQSPQDAPSGSPSLSSSSQSLFVTSNSFSIDWDPPGYEEQNGVIQYYEIRITEVETGIVYQYTRYTTHINLFTLHPAYTYLFQVAAYTVGLGPYSEFFNITLAEDVPSGSPNLFSGSSSTSSSIALSWDPPSIEQQNGVIISYFIVVSKLNSDVTSNYTVYGAHFSIPNLIPFSKYSCKIAAQTAIGTGPFTISITITTLEDAPNVSPIVTVGYSIDSSTVAIQWTPPPPEDHNGIIREYRVLITNVNTGENETRVFSSNTGIIGMLTPSYVYKLSVTAVTVAEGPYSTSITITLPEDVPSGYPQSIQGNSTSPDGIFLSWSPPADEEQNGLIVQYIVNVTHTDTLDTMQYFTTKTFIHISGLDPYTTYVCVVAAETSVGIGPFSNLYFIQTIEDVPDSAPLHASGISLGPSSIHITWDPPAVEDHNGVIREYRVNVTQIATQYYTQLVTNQTQIIIENLKPYHIYHCYVSAITIDEGPYTTAVTVLTDEAAPITSPQSLSVTVIDSVSISVTWSIPQPISDHNGIIRSYSIKVTAISEINSEAFLFSSQSTSFNTSVLSPFTTYSVQVAAVTVSTGPFTTSYNITTQEDVSSSSPQQFNSSTLSPTTVHLTWLPPHPSDVNGIIQYYSLTYFEIETELLSSENVTTISTIVSNLHPFYTYQFTVSAVTIGIGPVTSILLQMPESAPSVAPTGTVTSNISTSRVHLSWDALPEENRNGIVRHYLVNLTEADTGMKFELVAYSNDLIIQDLHPYYTYHVTVAAHTVDIGPYSAVTIFQMNEDVPTGSPTDLSVIVLNSTDVQISWSPTPLSEQNGIISSYYLSVTDSDIEVAFTPLITNMTSTTFGGLVPYTTYYCTVAAYTSVGGGPSTSFVYFETDEAAPTSPPEDVTITNVSSTEIYISWTEPLEDQINGIIRNYEIELAEVETNVIITETTAHNEIIVSSLHPYYQYKVSVAAVTIATGPFSTPLSVTTKEAAPSSAPTSLTASIISSTSLNVSWNDPPPHDANGVIDYCNVKVQVSETTETVYYEAPTKNLLLTDLHPYYTYTIFVAAVTIAEGPFSAASSVHTPADVPSGSPLNVTGSVISYSIIEVSWDPPNDLLQNGPIQSYTIIVFEIDTNTTTQEHRDFLHNSIVLTDLHPNYEYDISIAAFTIGLGPSTNIQLRTLEDVPTGSPNDIQVNVTSSTSATLQWTEPDLEKQNGNIKHYRITLLDNSELELQTLISSSLSIKLENLDPFNSYVFEVQAVTTAGNGPKGNITFTTPQDVPASSPSSLSASSITSTGVTLSWLPLHVSDQNGIIIEYIVVVTEMNTNNQWNLSSNATTLAVRAILSPHTSYEFSVAAKTIIGNGPFASYVPFVTREDSPVSSPRELTVSFITSTSFVLSWIPPFDDDINGVVTGYIVSLTVQETQEIFAFNASTTNISLSQLHPFYTHHCSVTCVTLSEGPYSDIASVTTLQDAPSSALKSFNVTTPHSHAVSITWSPLPLSELNGIIKYYSVHFTVAETLQTFENKTDKINFILTNAHPYYTYSVKVSAVTVAYGPYTPVISVTTPQNAPTGLPLNLTLNSLNSTSVTFSWLPPQANKQNGIIQKYIVLVYEVLNDVSMEIDIIGATHATITDLHPSYNYDVSVSAFTIAIGPVISSSFTTEEDIPGSAPLNVSLVNITSTSVIVQWNPPLPHDHNGLIRYYTITLVEITTNTYLTLNSTDLFIVLENLHPHYDYNFSISAVTIGLGPSNNGMFTLLEDAPTASPQNISLLSLSPTILLISWEPVEESFQNGEIQFYRVIVFDLENSDFYIEVDMNESTSVNVTDLKPFHTYGVQVTAYTVGLGPASVTVNITQPQSEPALPPSELIAILDQQNVTLHVSWISPPIDGINGILFGYQITCNSLNSHQLSVNVSATSVSLYPLQPETHYTCSVCAYTVIGCGPVETVHVSTYSGSLVGPPLSVVVSSVGTTNIHLHWNPPFDPNNVILGYGITYHLLKTSFPIETPRPPVTIPSLSTETKYNIQSLLANTVYRIVVFAVFEEGTGPTSEETIVKTIEQDEYSVTSYECLSVSSDSLSCSWDHPVPPNDYYIEGYQISYRLADGFDYYPGYGTVLNRISLSSMIDQYTIIELRPYTGYIVVLECIMLHDIGSGEFAMEDDQIDNITSISSLANVTQPSVAEETVEEFSVAVTSPSSVDVSWKPPNRVSWNGQIVSYNISFERRSAITGDDNRKKRQMSDSSVISYVMVSPKANHYDPSLAMEPLKTESYSFENLEENFEYHLSCAIINSKGAGTSTKPIVQIMPESVPSGPPINIILANATTSSIELQWMPPNPIDANGVIVMYSLNFTRIRIKETVLQQFSSNQLSFEKQGLQVYETIGISMAAKTSVGWGPYSNVLYFNTLEDSPSGPVDLTWTLNNDGSVFLTWKAPNTPNGVIVGYQIVYNGHDASQTSVLGETFTKYVSVQRDNNVSIVDNLVQGYFYQIKVRAQNGAGYGENSTVAVLIPAPDIGRSDSSEDIIFGFGVTTTATTVSLIVLVLIVIVVSVFIVIYVVKRKSGKSKSVCIHQNETLTERLENRGGTLELSIPMQSVSLENYSSRPEENEYEHISFKTDELPDLKKQTCSAEVDSDTSSDSDTDEDEEESNHSGSDVGDSEINKAYEKIDLSFM